MVRPLIPLRNTLFRKIRNRKEGFSLLEVMLAILLFGTGFAFLLQIVSTGLFAGGVNENDIIAANLVREKIEEFRNSAYSNVTEETPAEAVAGFPLFTREVLVTNPITNMKQITVNVYWYVRGAQASLSAVSYVSDV